MRVLVAMSGGVDSSVAAALCLEAGHDVTGVTLKLWGGESDSGCCSVADVEDARRVADRLEIDHHMFNFGDDFDARVVEPYAADHDAGRTPNPCIECNRHLKFDRLLERADALGFDAVATGHHARLVDGPDGGRRVARGADHAKDQSYVLHMLAPEVMSRLLFPVGDHVKDEVRAAAARLGLDTADKPDSQDVCFITRAEGRERFLGERLKLRPGRVVDLDGREIGSVPSVQLVTIGQRKGLDLAGGGERRYVVATDPATDTITVGAESDLSTATQPISGLRWIGRAPDSAVSAQCSAHSPTHMAQVEDAQLVWESPQRRVAPGQAIVFYDGADRVVGAAVAERG